MFDKFWKVARASTSLENLWNVLEIFKEFWMFTKLFVNILEFIIEFLKSLVSVRKVLESYVKMLEILGKLWEASENFGRG